MRSFIVVTVLLSAFLIQLINGAPQWQQWTRNNTAVVHPNPTNNNSHRNNGMLQTLTGPYQPQNNNNWQQWGRNNNTASNSKPAWLHNTGSAHPYFQVPGGPRNSGNNGRNYTSGGQNVPQSSNAGWVNPGNSVNPASNGMGGRASYPGNNLSNNTAHNQWNPNGNSYPNNQWKNNGNSQPNWNAAQRPAGNLVNGSNAHNPVFGSGGAHTGQAPNNGQNWNPGSTIFGFPGAAQLEPIRNVNNQPAPYQGQGGGSYGGSAQLAPLAGSGSWNNNGGAQRQAQSPNSGYSNPYANLFIV